MTNERREFIRDYLVNQSCYTRQEVNDADDESLEWAFKDTTKNLRWTINDACESWGLLPSRVKVLCRAGRVIGAKHVVRKGNVYWSFPPQPKPEEKKPGRKRVL